MIFSIVVIILIGAITFFHYLQGFFSATLSTILVIISAVVAFSLHEQIAENLLINRAVIPTMADGAVLMALFAVIYLFLRVIFDKAVPGNLQLPAALDKVGAGIMGLIAAVFATGVLAIAAQELPFNQDVGGYTKFKTVTRGAYVKGKNGKQKDSNVYNELMSNKLGEFDPIDRSIMYPPVDDIVVGTVKHLSDNGSLSGSQQLSAIHPSFLEETFGQRLGIQAGANTVAFNRTGQGQVISVDSLYELPGIQTDDYLPDTVRDRPFHKKIVGTLKPGETFGDGQRVGKDQVLLVVRLIFHRAAGETDHFVRFSPASARLVGMRKDPSSGEDAPGDYYPWGVVENQTLYVTKPDDYLFANQTETENCAVDLLYVVDKPVIASGNKIAEGTFIEVKRTYREDLSGQKVADAPTAPPSDMGYGIVHPFPPEKPPAPPPAPTPKKQNPVAQAPAPATPPGRSQPNAARGSFTSAQANVGSIGGKIFNFAKVEQSNLLPTAVAVPSADLDKPMIEVGATGVEAIVKDKKFLSLTVKPTVAVAQLGTGDFKTRELSIPDGKIMIQLVGNTPSDPWIWLQKVPDFTLVTSDHKNVKANGAWAIIKQGAEDRLMAQYSTDLEISRDAFNGINPQGQPTQVVLAFIVPDGVKPEELQVDGQLLKSLTQEPMNKVQ